MDSDLQQYLDKIEPLAPDTQPVWGEMTPQHMVEHLIMIVRVSNGKIEGKAAYDGRRQKVMKRFLQSDKPMPRQFTNPLIGPDLKPLMFKDLATAKRELAGELYDFSNYFDENPNARPVNPTFGPLNREEWIRFHHKHFTHHLKQFGLLD